MIKTAEVQVVCSVLMIFSFDGIQSTKPRATIIVAALLLNDLTDFIGFFNNVTKKEYFSTMLETKPDVKKFLSIY